MLFLWHSAHQVPSPNTCHLSLISLLRRLSLLLRPLDSSKGPILELSLREDFGELELVLTLEIKPSLLESHDCARTGDVSVSHAYRILMAHLLGPVVILNDLI